MKLDMEKYRMKIIISLVLASARQTVVWAKNKKKVKRRVPARRMARLFLGQAGGASGGKKKKEKR